MWYIYIYTHNDIQRQIYVKKKTYVYDDSYTKIPGCPTVPCFVQPQANFPKGHVAQTGLTTQLRRHQQTSVVLGGNSWRFPWPWGYPWYPKKAGWFMREKHVKTMKLLLQWMMTGGTSIYGNPQLWTAKNPKKHWCPLSEATSQTESQAHVRVDRWCGKPAIAGWQQRNQ